MSVTVMESSTDTLVRVEPRPAAFGICESCGESFVLSVYKPQARFCGATCRQRHRRARLLAQGIKQTQYRKPRGEKRGAAFAFPKPRKEQSVAVLASRVKYRKDTYTDEELRAELERIGRSLGRHRYRELSAEMVSEIERRKVMAG